MSRHYWTTAEIEYLRNNAGKFTAEYIGLRLKRTPDAVRAKACHVGVKFSDRKKWTNEEVRFLEDNAGAMSPTEIAKALGRNCNSVRVKAWNIGINFGLRFKFSDEDVALCKSLHNSGMRDRLIAEKMEIPIATVWSYTRGIRRKNVAAHQG